MAVLKLDAIDRALLKKALHTEGVKDTTPENTALLNLIERRELSGTDEQLNVMQKGLVKVGHLSRQFRQRDNARLADNLANRIQLFKKERRTEPAPFNGHRYGRADGQTGKTSYHSGE